MVDPHCQQPSSRRGNIFRILPASGGERQLGSDLSLSLPLSVIFACRVNFIAFPHRVKEKRQSGDESQNPADQNVNSHLWGHLLFSNCKPYIKLKGDLVFIIFWPPHCGHALDVEPDEVVEGGAADPVDPEENHLVAQLVPGLTLLPRVGDDGHHQESCPKHDVQDGEREDPLVEPLTPHVVS